MRLIKNVSEPWFTLIALGLKKVEGRLRKGDFADVKQGQVIVWRNDELGFPRTVKTTVKSTQEYSSFEKYLKGECLKQCLPAPGVTSMSKGVAVYRKYYTKELEREHGIVAIRLSL